MKERLQKILSLAGLASRRNAETFIERGLVTVNGRKASLGDKADPDTDRIMFRGKQVKVSEEKLYLAMNKPKGYMVSRHDPYGRKNAFQLLPVELQKKLWNVGRLDYETEGLILFTNDGLLTQKLAHPSFEHDKEYEVTLANSASTEQMQKLREGVKLRNGFVTSPAKVRQSGNKLYITIHEGKKHQIRRMIKSVSLELTNLKRIRIGKLKLSDTIQPGKYEFVKKESIL